MLGVCRAPQKLRVEELARACASNNPDTVRSLIKQGIAVDAVTKAGDTAACLAARHGSFECLSLLLVEAGADPNQADSEGGAPAHYAATGGHLECLDVICTVRGDVNQADADGATALHRAAAAGHLACVERLLRADADLDRGSKFGSTPVMHAARRGRVDCLRLLADAGADLDKANRDGSTAAHYAAASEKAECLELLVDRGVNVTVRAKNGSTPAHWAAYSGRPDCLRLLRDAGVDLAARDLTGWTPATYADKGKRTAGKWKLRGSTATSRSSAGDDGLASPELMDRIIQGALACLEMLEEEGAGLSTAPSSSGTGESQGSARAPLRRTSVTLSSAAFSQLVRRHRADPAARTVAETSQVAESGRGRGAGSWDPQ